MKRLQAKQAVFIALLVLVFVYANVTAGTKSHEARVRVLPDAELLTSLISDISGAEQSVYIAIYMFKSYRDITSGAGMIKSALMKAAKRGVDVYVAFEQGDNDDFVDKENRKTAKELERSGVRTAFDQPNKRMHSKCAVIDGQITYIGSHNYTNSALKHNRELTVRIESPEVAKEAADHILSIR